MDRPHALVSVYACDPERGSEPGVGFRWLELYLALGWRVTALTHGDRRGGVARTLARLRDAADDGRLRVEVVAPTPVQRALQELPGCWWLYYRAWQRSAAGAARALVGRERVDLAHHVSMNGFREPGDLWRLDVPFVWGPIGGVQDADPRLVALQPWPMRAAERARRLANRWCARHAPRPRAARRRARLVLAANRDARAWAPLALPLLETACDARAACDDGAERDGVLWVGSDEPRKNPEFALAAFALARRLRPRLRLTLVGLSQRRQDALAAWAARRRIPLDGVALRGRVERGEIDALYRAARVFWFTSYRDTSGNVVLEAMAGGAPVVAFAQHGAAEMLADGAGALVAVAAPARALRAWTRATIALVDDDAAWRATRRAATARLERRYRWARTAEAFAAALRGAGLPSGARAGAAREVAA